MATLVLPVAKLAAVATKIFIANPPLGIALAVAGAIAASVYESRDKK